MSADNLSPDEPVECADDEHDWKIVSDWYGDPGVINGTADCSYKECLICGKEKPLEIGDYQSAYDD